MKNQARYYIDHGSLQARTLGTPYNTSPGAPDVCIHRSSIHVYLELCADYRRKFLQRRDLLRCHNIDARTASCAEQSGAQEHHAHVHISRPQDRPLCWISGLCELLLYTSKGMTAHMSEYSKRHPRTTRLRLAFADLSIGRGHGPRLQSGP